MFGSEYIITFKNDGGNIIKLHNIPNSHFYISVQPNKGKEEKLDSIEMKNQSCNLCFYHSIESAILALGLIKNGNEIDSTLEIVKACISSKYFNKDSYKKDELKIRFLISLLNTTERRLQEAKYRPNVIRLLKLQDNIIEELKNLSPLYNFAKNKGLIDEIVDKEMEFNEKDFKDENYNKLISYIKNGNNKDEIEGIIVDNKHIFCKYLPNEDSNELNDNNYINYYLTDNKNDSNERILLELLHYYNEAYYSEDDGNKKNNYKTKLDELIKIIELNVNTEKLDMPFIAAQMHMSHSTLYRKIKGLLGISGTEFIRRIRLRYSLKLMLEEGYNISEAAYATGFSDVGYFRNCFKGEYGMTPSEYMKQQKSSTSVKYNMGENDE